MFSVIVRTARLFAFSGLVVVALATAAHSFERELDELARKLVEQLEAAGQINGTVLDFTDLQGQPNELGRFLAQELSDKLVGSARTVSFLDRAGLQYLLKENELSADGLVDPQSTRKLGNLIGVDTLIVGTATPLGEKLRISVRAIAVETGRIVGSQSLTFEATEELGSLYEREISSSGVVGSAKESLPTPTVIAGQQGISFQIVRATKSSDGRRVSIGIVVKSERRLPTGAIWVQPTPQIQDRHANTMYLADLAGMSQCGYGWFDTPPGECRFFQNDRYVVIPPNGAASVNLDFRQWRDGSGSEEIVGDLITFTGIVQIAGFEKGDPDEGKFYNISVSVPEVRLSN